MILNSKGFDIVKTKDLVKHWNIKGKYFFDLHIKIEELYTEANIKIVETS